MRRIIVAVAIAALAIQVHAADILVDAGNIRVPDAAVSDVKEWLATLTFTEDVLTAVEMVDPDDGHLYTNIVRTVVVLSLNPQQKLRKTYRDAGDKAVRSGLRNFRQARADAEEAAALAAMPDPIADEE